MVSQVQWDSCIRLRLSESLVKIGLNIPLISSSAEHRCAVIWIAVVRGSTTANHQCA
jgi:hypothetical protein